MIAPSDFGNAQCGNPHSYLDATRIKHDCLHKPLADRLPQHVASDVRDNAVSHVRLDDSVMTPRVILR